MLNVAARVKVSHQSGYGHWVRQCHLARSLIQNGCRVDLYPDTGATIEAIAVKGAQIIPVTGNDHFLQRLPADTGLVILDIHDTSPEWIAQLRRKTPRVAGFEDLGSGRSHLDLLVDCNLDPEQAGELPNGVEALFGYSYSLLAEEYESVARQPRDFKNGVRRVLITMGGSDPNQLTSQILPSIIEHNPSLQLTVVLGPGFRQENLLKSWVDLDQVDVISSPKSLGELLLIHDAVICAGGVTLHEALAAGTPAFVVPQVEHQEDLARKLEDRDAAWLVGTPGVVNANFLLEALETPSRTLMAMSRRGRSLIDGGGLKRITKALIDLTEK